MNFHSRVRSREGTIQAAVVGVNFTERSGVLFPLVSMEQGLSLPFLGDLLVYGESKRHWHNNGDLS
jgi:hypothetical protein